MAEVWETGQKCDQESHTPYASAVQRFTINRATSTHRSESLIHNVVPAPTIFTLCTQSTSGPWRLHPSNANTSSQSLRRSERKMLQTENQNQANFSFTVSDLHGGVRSTERHSTESARAIRPVWSPAPRAVGTWYTTSSTPTKSAGQSTLPRRFSFREIWSLNAACSE